jgi:hypothetical protein
LQLDCIRLEAKNVFPHSGADPGTMTVCSFEASFALTVGVTGNYFEGLGAPSPWTGSNVDVILKNRLDNKLNKRISGAVRVSGCRLNFKDKTVTPPILLANSSMECGWKETGIAKSLIFTSYDGVQTITIIDKDTSNWDDTWPFFCQVTLFIPCNLEIRLHHSWC